MAGKTKVAAKAAAKPAEKVEKKKGGSVLAGLDAEVNTVAGVVEKAMKQVGGDVARGFAKQALDKINEAVDLLAKAEREDR